MDATGAVPAARRIARLRRTLAVGLALAAFAIGTAAVAAEEGLEASVKAAYLYKFIGYVDWPGSAFASNEAPYVIGVAGDDAVLAELQRLLAGRSVNGRPLVATRVATGEPVEPLHVLYVGRGVRTAAALRAVAGRAVLTVADGSGAVAEGAVLGFLLVQGKVRFEASQRAAERAGLKLSARLLAVAERVITP